MSETLTDEQKAAKAEALLKQEIENKRIADEEEDNKKAELKAKELKDKLNKERAENKDTTTRLAEAEAKIAKMEADKEEAEKTLLTELVLLDPKVGEAMKGGDKKDLEIALKTVKLYSGSTFGDHSQAGKEQTEDKTNTIGVYDRASGEWI